MKRGTPDHPKVSHLATLLNINRAWAIGILEALWHFAARYAPQGDIGKHPDSVIAKAVYWERPTGERGVKAECKLSAALVEAGWLDTCPVHRLIVHDWCDHADEAVTKYLSRHGLSFVETAASRLAIAIAKPVPVQTGPTFDQAKGWLADWIKNGATYTEYETRGAFLALQANGWMWAGIR